MKYLLRFPIGPVTLNMDREPLPDTPFWYWLLPTGLIAFGTIAAAGIGLPLLAMGLFLVLRGIAGRPRRDFWPPIVGVILFFVAFWGIGYLFGPISCSTVFSRVVEVGLGETEGRATIDDTRTTCDSPFLPEGIKGEAPSLWPVLWSAVGIGLGGASLTRLALARRDPVTNQPIRGPNSKSFTKSRRGNRGANLLYWVVTGVFIVFGFLAIFSVGLPLLILGLALAALSDIRDHPQTFWPPLAGIALFFVAYFLVAPLACTQTEIPVTVENASEVEQIEPMTCTRIILPDYRGDSEPALWPSVVAAAVTAAMGAMITRYLIGRRAKRTVERLA